MIERVAIVIHSVVCWTEWADLPDENTSFGTGKIERRKQARAAIEAMREPTEEMENAPWQASVQVYQPTDITQTLDSISFKRVYQAMIEAALK